MDNHTPAICEHPDHRNHRGLFPGIDKFIVLYRECYCGLATAHLCMYHKFPTRLICPKCVTGDIHNKYNYICHINSLSCRYDKSDVILKINDKTYLEYIGGWYLYEWIDDCIFNGQLIFTADLKPYTFIPIVEGDMKNTENNYINVIPKDIVGVISSYLNK